MNDKQKKVKCPECGFRIRGKNHENGPHHKGGKNGKAKVGDR